MDLYLHYTADPGELSQCDSCGGSLIGNLISNKVANLAADAIHRLAERIAEEGRACVLIVNKWDAVEDKVSSLLLYHAAAAKAGSPALLMMHHLHAECDASPAACRRLQGCRMLRALHACSAVEHLVQTCHWHAQDTNTLMEHQKDLLAQLRPVSWANVVYTSAKTGQRLSKVLEAVAAAGMQHRFATASALMWCDLHSYCYSSHGL